MFLTCPHCTVIFRIKADLIAQDGQNVCCSICQYIRVVSLVSPFASQPVVQSAAGGVSGSHRRPVILLSVACVLLKHLWRLCLTAVLVAGLASGVIMNRGMVTASLPFLFKGFDRGGLSIRPAVAQLQVAGLNASFVVNTMRLFGRLRNIGMRRTYVADLLVTVRGVDGTIVQGTVLRPGDDVIDSQAESRFFVQLAV